MANILLLKAQSEESKKVAEDPYISELTQQNFHVQLAYSLDFHFYNLNTLSEKLGTPDSYSGIIFTSPRSVCAVTESLESNALPHGWQLKKVFVVSETTDRLVRSKLSLSSTIGATAGNEDALIPLICQEVESTSKPLLLPIGNLSSHKILKRLKEKDILVEELQVYKTIPHPALKEQMEKIVERNAHDVIVFFSPSGIEFTKPFLTRPFIEKVKFVAIGPTTKQALIGADLPVASTSAKPNPGCLIEAIKSALKQDS